MLPIFRDAPNVKDVTPGQPATCDFDVGWNYYILRFIATVTKDAAAATEPTLAEALGQIVLNVNKDPKRTMNSYELNAIQRAWSDNAAATLYSKVGNDLKTATVDGNANGNVQRTSTWVLDVMLAEPTRDSYAARKAFSWPTKWNNAAVGGYPANYTANIQAVINVPSDASLSNPTIRCEMMVDGKFGPLVGKAGSTGAGVIGEDVLALAGIPSPGVGSPIMPITQWYRWNKNYSATAVQIRGTDWPFNKGTLQQLSMFCPTDQPDIITDVQVLLDTAFKVKSTKKSIEKLQRDWNWSPTYGTTYAGTAGTDYPAVNALHLAFDFTDDPTDALSSASYNTLELNLTLAQAASANPNIIMIAQFYRNALIL